MAKAKAGKRPDWDGKLYYKWEREPESLLRTGRHPAVINRIEDAKGLGISLKMSKSARKLPQQGFAEILVKGPLYDVTTAGVDVIVSEAVQPFLAERAGGHCHFLPVDLLDKKGRPIGKRYYGIQFVHSLAAIPTFMEYDLEKISSCGFPLLLAYNKKDSCMNALFIEANLAEEMIAAGFTGLGFSNVFDDRKPTSVSVQRLAELELLPKTEPEIRLDKLKNNALSATSPAEGWASLLALLEKEKRSKKWPDLAGLNVDADAKAAGKWLSRLFTANPPDAPIKAFWFGLYEEYADDCVIPMLYIRGSATYSDDAPYDIEWAVDSTWRGSDDAYNSLVMQQLGELAENHEALADTVMYTAVLGYATLLVRFALSGLTNKCLSALGGRKCPVAIGFDSGDFLLLGDLTKAGIKSQLLILAICSIAAG